MTKRPIENISFNIVDIDVRKFSLNSPTIDQEVQIKFNLGIEHHFNREAKQILVMATVALVDHVTQSIEFASAQVAFIYQVEQFDAYYKETENQMAFPEPFSLALNSISISTLRGVLYGQLKGTYLDNMILPMIDPKLFAQQKPNTSN
jgi:hypothetical protein